MIKCRYDWNGDTALKVGIDAAWDGLRRAVVFFHNSLLLALNVSNPRPYLNSSRPGEPPRARTGWLKKHVIYEFDKDKLQARVGVLSNALYGLFLELGTRKMKPRPWLLATLNKVIGQMRALAGKAA